MPASVDPELIPALFKWALGLLSTALIGCFGWIWKTDRDLQKLSINMDADRKACIEYKAERERAEKADQEDRRVWRNEMLEGLKALSQRIEALSTELAENRGAAREKNRAAGR